MSNLTQKRIEAENNGGKDWKALYKLMNNTVYDKITENVRNELMQNLWATKRAI